MNKILLTTVIAVLVISIFALAACDKKEQNVDNKSVQNETTSSESTQSEKVPEPSATPTAQPTEESNKENVADNTDESAEKEDKTETQTEKKARLKAEQAWKSFIEWSISENNETIYEEYVNLSEQQLEEFNAALCVTYGNNIAFSVKQNKKEFMFMLTTEGEMKNITDETNSCPFNNSCVEMKLKKGMVVLSMPSIVSEQTREYEIADFPKNVVVHLNLAVLAG